MLIFNSDKEQLAFVDVKKIWFALFVLE